MRKDVKRSIVIWPATAVLFVVSLCALAMQSRNGAGFLAAGVVHLIPNLHGWVFRHQSDPVDGTRPAGKASMPSSGTRWADARYPRELDSWDNLPPESEHPLPAGIPAPKLTLQSDLFGFPVASDSASVPTEQRHQKLATREGESATAFADFPENRDAEQWARPLFQTAEISSAGNFSTAVARDVADRDVAPGEDFGDDISLPPLDVMDDDTTSPVDTLVGGSSPALRSPGRPARVLPSDRRDSEGADVAAVKFPKRGLASPRSPAWPVSIDLISKLETLDHLANSDKDSGPGYAMVSQDSRSRVDSPQSPSETEIDAQAENDPDISIAEWSRTVKSLLDELHSARRLGDSKVGEVLSELDDLQQQASVRAERLRARRQQVAWLQAAYALERRLAVWKPIHEINSGQRPLRLSSDKDVATVSDSIRVLREALPATGDVDGWVAFLLLDELQSSFVASDEETRRELAQTFLARLHWPTLAPEHRQWLNEPAVQDLASAVRPWATSGIDYASLLHQIERAESNSIDLVTAEIAESMRALRASDHPQAKRLAKNLDVHYRNANLRFAIRKDLIAYLLPEIPPREVPVRTNLLGSRVTGISRIDSDLQLRLIPAKRRWELQLETVGNVTTRSTGLRGPAVFNTDSENSFTAATPITVLPTDVNVGSSVVDVAGGSKLRDIRTDYDGWPLVGTLVRRIAESEYWKNAPLSQRIAGTRLSNQVGSEIDQRISDKLADASQRFSDSILGPLNHLQLDPTVIDMETTPSRLVARYRMAGDWQLAAMTPRPRAPSDSMMSVQLHQSAINNTLEQLVPQQEMMPLEEMLRECYALLGMQPPELNEDFPEDVSVQFARHRPITVEIENGKAFITMRIIRLHQGDRVRLSNFIVRAAYKPNIDGLAASLERDGHLSISGPGMSFRQRLPVRAIFNKVFSPNQTYSLTAPELLQERVPEGTQISQLELRDGWIGVAISQRESEDRVAGRPAVIR
ncbi:hypothetical protein FYK55_03185 [Roseiconus nitratireducens]|uniref:Uncharacterized protein n=1 Tax=Roseiconus nitratireducens TaxID=2605748 RepID=A0A5M6DEE6_9BACT|nr:hypothetical protein [Roseiconus nitratireducens]KAA5545931.1 hypothetical protein FYK55_03185 [Roseiconus nitratireducens]